MKSLGQVLREAFINMNPRDDMKHHLPWEELSEEKRLRYDATANLVVIAAAARTTPVKP